MYVGNYAANLLQYQQRHEVGLVAISLVRKGKTLTPRLVSIMQDLAIYLVPVLIVSNLQMPRAQKFALAALLGVGLVAVAGMYKSPDMDSQSAHIEQPVVCASTTCSFSSTKSTTFTTTWPTLSTGTVSRYTSVRTLRIHPFIPSAAQAELTKGFCIGIICSCASTFKILISRFIPKISHYVGRSNGQSTGKTPRNQREGSHSDQIFMKRLSSNRLTGNRKYGVDGITEIGNESQEAIVKSQ